MHGSLAVGALKALVVIGFMCAGVQASATQYFFCFTEPAYGDDKDLLALSAVMEVEVDRLDEDWLALDWSDHLDEAPTEGIRSFRNSKRNSCITAGSRSWIEEQFREHYLPRYRWGTPVTWAPTIKNVVPRPPSEGLVFAFGDDDGSAPKQDAAEATDGKGQAQQDPSPSDAAEQSDLAEVEKARLAAEDRARREAEERDRREAAETARLNREAAEFAANQIAENEASRRKAEAERKAYEAELARVEREKAQHELAMEQNRREREEANRRQQEYFAAQRRHALCIGGDRKACADIEAGKPALADASTEEEASTEEDATRCVSAPVVSADSTFRGSTQAVVVNGCEAPVDVRVCLMRTGGWNCGTTWNLAPQARWAHTSFESDGQVFWDARVSTSSRALAKP